MKFDPQTLMGFRVKATAEEEAIDLADTTATLGAAVGDDGKTPPEDGFQPIDFL